MNDAELLQHLVDCHEGVHVPWFVGSGFIERLGRAQLERLHDELVRQGEDCDTPANIEPHRRAAHREKSVQRCLACNEECSGAVCGCLDTCWRRQRQFPPHRRVSA